MQRQMNRGARYRKQANKYAELAKDAAQPDFLITIFQQTAVRYALMAEDLERQDSFSTSLAARTDALLGILKAAGSVGAR
jgi:hypothetical protein